MGLAEATLAMAQATTPQAQVTDHVTVFEWLL
jgi:hypothetical protein